VLAAIREYDDKGRRAFLKEYGFGGARGYYLVVRGKNYDSKAIVAVAHKYLSAGRALTKKKLFGGKDDAAKKLIALGFDVTSPGENADWTWDEHVLALDLYFELQDVAFGKNHPAIAELSKLLRNAGERIGVATTAKFRNFNGVYMKLMNFRRLDPRVQSQGQKGLTRGSGGEVKVWNRFADDRPGLEAAAKIIRNEMQKGSERASVEDPDQGGAEGSIVIRIHKARERDPALVAKKKAAVLKATGKLACEACDLTFGERYGPHGEGFIEVHHNEPIALSRQGRKTNLSQLACVCSNCHRMLHRNGLQSIKWLKQQLLLATFEQDQLRD
jgi:5-methylcytosine-specific restriction protein A